MKLAISIYVVLILSMVMVAATAKKGCAKYGHSCFGGHGKRSIPSDYYYTVDTLNNGQDRNMDYYYQGELYQDENPLLLLQKIKKWIEAQPMYYSEQSYGRNY